MVRRVVEKMCRPVAGGAAAARRAASALVVRGMLGVLGVLGVATAQAGCASTDAQPRAERIPEAPSGPGESNTPSVSEIEGEILFETRKTAAAQLECPEDEVIVQCTRRDRHGGCVAVQGKGCGRTLDYNFGND